MLPAKPNDIQVALNRVTFGARDLDVQSVEATGWPAWVETQLSPPDGDDPALDAHIKAQTMKIKYPAANPMTTNGGTWEAVDEDRPLNYIDADTEELWYVATQTGKAVAFQERYRVQQELAAATWIRNAHSQFQLREFMADFWHNHFNIGKAENQIATTILPVYDRVAIRQHVFGNFREMLEANATSTSMLLYLDNATSGSTTPNENYAREIMELHTLGEGAYLGTADPKTVEKGPDGVAVGFTDQDIIEVSKAFSGWTIEASQRINDTIVPYTGKFFFNPVQHNPWAGTVLGVDIFNLANMTQGQKVLDIIAAHPATATFICTKLCERIFGDNPPQEVVDRAVTAWMDTAEDPDQIAEVLRAIVLDGEEIFTEPASKVRRPYERIIALARTTDSTVSAAGYMTAALDALNDGLFAWQAPNGRPDDNAYWLATGATIATWNFLLWLPNFPEFSATFDAQTPVNSASSPTGVVEYWVGRMIGYEPSAAVMDTLIADQAGPYGVPYQRSLPNNSTNVELVYRRLVSLIAAAEEFALR